jgi:hypothetical protein
MSGDPYAQACGSYWYAYDEEQPNITCYSPLCRLGSSARVENKEIHAEKPLRGLARLHKCILGVGHTAINVPGRNNSVNIDTIFVSSLPSFRVSFISLCVAFSISLAVVLSAADSLRISFEVVLSSAATRLYA